MEIIESHRVPIAQLLEKELPTDLVAMLQDAMNEGYAFADVLSLLSESGYKVVIHPANEDDPQPQPGVEFDPQATENAAAVENAAEVPDTFTPPQTVQEAAQRAQKWVEDGFAGDGFTDVGRARMAQLSRGDAVSLDTIKKMYAYFSRHSVDALAEGWEPGEDGFPSPGRVAWDAWGGDPGRDWVNGIYKRFDLAKAQGMFPVVKAAEERRFTLGPMYVPDFLDAHGEWTDPDELQRALWDYVKAGDRRIRLQHNREIVAGEWVEAMTWPYPVTVPMYKATGELTEYTYPAGTVFLGVQWETWAWELVKRGDLRGYSIGGTTDRILADFPDGSEEVQPVPAVEAEKSSSWFSPQHFMEAIKSAVKEMGTTVNVNMPESKIKSRRLERDEHGNIVRIIEEQ